MSPSIRTYLLINLLLSVTLITSLAIIGNLFLAHQNIQLQLDAQLIRTTLRMQAIFSGPVDVKEFHIIQSRLKGENKHLDELKNIPHLEPEALRQAAESLEFQIWDKKGRLLLHSEHALRTPFSNGVVGLSKLWLDGHTWHVSTGYNQSNRLTIMVAERASYRQELEDHLTQDSVIVMLITYPFLGVLIWIIVGRGLETLRRVAKEVHQRAPSHLESVDLESVPTEIEPLVQELNFLFERLQAAFEREKRFTADAAHELKTPLAALNTQAQVALRAQSTDEKKEALAKVLSGVQRSSHVVQQLLTLSRMEPEAGLSDTAPLCLAKEAAEIVGMLAPIAVEKNIELELLSPDCKATIVGNIIAIDILIRNLVDNAIRYSPSGSNVIVNIRESKDHVILSVTDNGPGVPEELRKRIFDRFFRVLGNNTVGSGLGLSIVQQIAKLHHATIELHTPPSGKGIEFRVIFQKIARV
ncbi:MAG: two-component sensor histidine kinase [Gammaproteobacteria bacterium RIFCSPLOWO2_02_FULL_42_14]|nr:MAG: two-component sensor histidine kinase [Gammaproteobacteria bacterium RIFCSPHIGHO2_02_FULL_42_43]OGT28634.1 MAG: two-component sensor histidine kinase [Gammaproteobacteria bacterium RIFCSPHIGHO2_01_FULL_42_8]OGT52422.1 MAG: two-component sensor histidine kinase [Gammaproteobacteria bacterium RIFCSPHIGHO2_12_FULL_41_25]OGT61972.1 MAG: two-component sensor histidine kinase [Gammaproteobacteria bacterium RIFCSPLOWO2_02_FULL_42_14]OGT86447.1 MAG: two-component sensor histidine kinase [Gammap